LCLLQYLQLTTTDNWVTVPTNSTLTISKQTVMIHPIVDSFYSPNPAHERSAGFAQAKGQTVTGPDKRVLTDAKTPGSGAESPHRSVHADDLVSGAIRRLRVE
jgi:glutamine amidotransferase